MLPRPLLMEQASNELSHDYQLDSLVNMAPSVQLTYQLLQVAIERQASDIHLEPLANGYRIRLRIDGQLQLLELPQTITDTVISKLKVMGQLDITERRLPQDGQFTFCYQQQRFSCRLSSLATLYGEKLVLRLFKQQHPQQQLEQLAMPASLLSDYQQILQAQQGLILLSGPTGSGKTTTLYSSLQWLNQVEKNICTIEDPIEMPLAGINQLQINPKIDLSFSDLLPALLRQDPDVIMVGEIRDKLSAAMVANSALTGHLVLSTLHASSSFQTLLRLLQLAVPPYLIAGSLKLIIAQRLVRCLCPHCKQLGPNISPFNQQTSIPQWLAIGCQRCQNGYHGRQAIYEWLPMSEFLIEQLNQITDNPWPLMTTFSPQQSLWQAGWRLVAEGITSLAELYAVLGYPVATDHGQ